MKPREENNEGHVITNTVIPYYDASFVMALDH